MPATPRETAILTRIFEFVRSGGDLSREIARIRRNGGYTEEETTAPLTKLMDRLKQNGEI